MIIKIRGYQGREAPRFIAGSSHFKLKAYLKHPNINWRYVILYQIYTIILKEIGMFSYYPSGRFLFKKTNHRMKAIITIEITQMIMKIVKS